RNFATGLRRGLPACGAGLLDCVPAFRMARIVRGRCATGIPGDLHSRARAGIAGVATRPRVPEAEGEDVDLHQATRCSVCLRCASHDSVQLHVARDTGPLRDLLTKTAWI